MNTGAVRGSECRLRARAVRAIPAESRRPSTPRRARPSRRGRPTDARPAPAGASTAAPAVEHAGRSSAPPTSPSRSAATAIWRRSIDPLGSAPIGDPSLSPAAHGITDDDLEAAAGLARRRPGRRDVGERVRGDREAAPRLLLDHRLRLSRTCSCPEEREWLRAGRRVGPLPAADGPGKRRGAARPHHAGRGLRALPAAHVPRQDALLDRRPRHAGADPRRDHLRRRRAAARATR